MRADIDITNFTAGELSPRMRGRIDVAKYFNGAEALLNMVIMPQGGITRRPGTLDVAAVGLQAYKPLLVDFEFSTLQAYVIEFGHEYARFYTNDGQIAVGGVPVQITTPYAASDLGRLWWFQSADTLYLLHPSYPPQVLTRSSSASWAINPLTVRDGPYLPINTTTTTLTPSGLTGAITITASSVVGINATPQNTGQGFLSTDVGRCIRIKLQSLWAWAIITAVTSTTVVNATVQPANANGAVGALDGAPWAAATEVVTGTIVLLGNYYQCVSGGTTGATGPTGTGQNIQDNTAWWNYIQPIPTSTAKWMMGKWSTTTGWPYVGGFWQNRMCLLGTNNQPNAVEASVTGDFPNFAATQWDGTVVGNNALSWVISDDEVNACLWVAPAGSAQAAQLGIGTTGGEQIFQAQTTGQALTPTNVQAYRETSYGSVPGKLPVRIGKSLLFVNATGRKVHEWTFSWQVNGYLGPDLAVLAEHVTAAGAPNLGIVQSAYQQNPHSVIWYLRADGQLIALTYLRDQDVVGWSQHRLGGQYYGGPPIVESICCIKAPGGTYDELWLAVLRTINGVPTRTIEVMTEYFEQSSVDESFFVDCAASTQLTYPAQTLTISGLTNTASEMGEVPAFTGIGVAAVGAALFSGATVGSILRVGTGKALVTGYTDAEHVTIQTVTPFANLAPVASGGWSLTPLSTMISGLAYLAGETVAILGDGQSMGTQVVPSNGDLTINPGASLVTVGLPYTPVVVTMPYEQSRAAVATQGRVKRIDHLYIRFHETVGALYGARQIDDWSNVESDDMETLDVRSASDPMGAALGLFSGIRRVTLPGGSDKEGRIVITNSDPMPLTVLAISAKADVHEVGQ